MERCIFVHPENVRRFITSHELKVAVIARPDSFMGENAEHVIVETEAGVHTRIYLASHQGVEFLIVYGRFGRIRSTSADIDFVSTQRALSFLGIEKIIGMFVTGSIQPETKAGEVYIPHDFVGVGGYNQSSFKERGFRNVDMADPFCSGMREVILANTKNLPHAVHEKGVYICFHGFPRIETRAELDYYASHGWDVVGQTLDPEATLARESGCHYAALAGTIDDLTLRLRFAENDTTARDEIDANVPLVRERMFNLFLASLEQIHQFQPQKCSCAFQGQMVRTRSKNFYYRPGYLLEGE